MRTIFASFDFSSTHLAMEDRNYADIHVAMGKRLPNLRQYVTGLGRPHPDYRSPYRAALPDFDDAEALKAAVGKSPAAKPVGGGRGCALLQIIDGWSWKRR
jgi:hypothetical protein